MDNLRDRIIAVLIEAAEFRGVYQLHNPDMRFLADAVIEELGMTIEHDGPPIVPPCHRYVTEWMSLTDDTTGEVNHD